MAKLPQIKSRGTLTTDIRKPTGGAAIGRAISDLGQTVSKIGTAWNEAKETEEGLNAVNEYNRNMGKAIQISDSDFDYKNKPSHQDTYNNVRDDALNMIPQTKIGAKYAQQIEHNSIYNDINLNSTYNDKMINSYTINREYESGTNKVSYNAGNFEAKADELTSIEAGLTQGLISPEKAFIQQQDVLNTWEDDRLTQNMQMNPRDTINNIGSYNVSAGVKNKAIKTGNSLINSQDNLMKKIDPSTGDMYTPEQADKLAKTKVNTLDVYDGMKIKDNEVTLEAFNTPSHKAVVLNSLNDLRYRGLLTDKEYFSRASTMENTILQDIETNHSKGWFNRATATTKLNELIDSSAMNKQEKIKTYLGVWNAMEILGINPNTTEDNNGQKVVQLYKEVSKRLQEVKHPQAINSEAIGIVDEDFVTWYNPDEGDKNAGTNIDYRNPQIKEDDIKFDVIFNKDGSIKYQSEAL